MEWFWSSTLCSILIILPVFFWRWTRNSGSKLPPGPRGWPIVGNILDVGTLPHRSLAVLKQKYGPIVWLNLGSINTMVVVSATAAEELFKNHDLSFIERAVVETTRSHDYYKSSMGVGSFGPYVRALRRICTVEMFSNKKISETVCIRQKCLTDTCSWIEKQVDCSEGGIEVKKFVFSAVFNMIGNMILSRDLVDPNSEMVLEFSAAITGIMECVGCPNVSDLFPWLRWFDLQGLRRRMDRVLAKLVEITSGMVKERLKEGGPQRKDFLDMLLDFEVINEKDEPAKLSEFQISIFLAVSLFNPLIYISFYQTCNQSSSMKYICNYYYCY